MRKPLLLLSVICCLLLSGATPLLCAIDRLAPSLEPSGDLNFNYRFIIKPISLPPLIYQIIPNIFNEGPDPVESSAEQKEDESSDEEGEEENSGDPGTLGLANGSSSNDKGE